MKNCHSTWCNAVKPSTLAVSMSAPFSSICWTSCLSVAAQAERNTQLSGNYNKWKDDRWQLSGLNAQRSCLTLILRLFRLGSAGSLFVSLSCHLLSCSERLNRAEADLFSRELMAKHGLTPLKARNYFFYVALMKGEELLAAASPWHFTCWTLDTKEAIFNPTWRRRKVSKRAVVWSDDTDVSPFVPPCLDRPSKLTRHFVVTH